MPGIAGIIRKGSTDSDASALQQMLKVMLYEKFYTSGTYINESLGIFLGWVNRAGAFSDCMPVWNESHDICLIYYGENFADKELSEKLKSQGHRFDAANASCLVHLYEEKGLNFLSCLNGWFSGILIDLGKQEAYLFNDRYAMQRIYFYETRQAFYFSSEAKALLKVCPELRQLNMKSLSEVSSFGCVLENRSLFSQVCLLPPGSVWTFANANSILKESYFTPDIWENQPPMEQEAFYTRLKETFVHILPKYLAAESKIALSLTGGLDTRMILACAEIPPGRLPCYTFGGMYNDCYDVTIGRKIAAVCGQKHQTLEVGRQFFTEFAGLAEKTVYITDGNLDVTGAADLYVNRYAREIAPVRLTGNYGSEILRGSRHLKAIPARAGLFESGFEKEINAAADTLSRHHQDNRLTFAAFKQAPWFHHNRLALEQSQLTLRSPYLDNELVGLMFRAPAETMNSNDLSFRLMHEGSPSLGSIMTDRGLNGSKNFLYSKSMHLYREFLFKADYAFNYGMPPWLATLDHYLLAPLHVERMFLGRHKFYHFRVWFRDELSNYVKEVLLDHKSLQRPYLNGSFAEKMVLDHTSGKQNNTAEITKLMTLELLQRLLLEQQ